MLREEGEVKQAMQANPPRRFQTDRRLWTVIGVALFVALGFVDPLTTASKGDNTLWAYVWRLVTSDYINSTSDNVKVILFRSAFQAVLAALFGWVLQAVVVIIRESRRTQPITAEEVR